MSHTSILPPDEETASLSTAQLLSHLSDDSYYLRGRVIAGLGQRLHESPDILPALVAAIQAPENRKTPFFGFIMVSWLGLITILENGNESQRATLKETVQNWPVQEREDIKAYWLIRVCPCPKFFPEYLGHG